MQMPQHIRRKPLARLPAGVAISPLPPPPPTTPPSLLPCSLSAPLLPSLMRPDSVESCYDLLMEAIFAQQPRVREAVAMVSEPKQHRPDLTSRWCHAVGPISTPRSCQVPAQLNICLFKRIHHSDGVVPFLTLPCCCPCPAPQLRNRHGIFVRSLCTARLHWLRQTCVLVLSFQPNAFVGVADEPGARRMRIAPPVAAVSNGYAPVGESMAAMGRG